MERAEYHRMAALEDTMWWYRALHAGLIARLGRTALPAGAAVLDAGCGTGGLLGRLAVARPDLALAGLEFDAEAAGVAQAKTGLPIAIGSVNAMPYQAGCFDAVVSADVLCHAGVEEAAALSEFHRCLRSGGRLLLNLPAFQWMASAHDVHVHNARRYTAGQARRMVAAAGFAGVATGYWNSLLFPLMLVHRLLPGRDRASSDVRPFPAWQNQLFFSVTAVERRLFGPAGGLPFGGSVWVWASKP